MKPCILHVGMPKTGTSSIQATLHHGLADRAFHYVSLGGQDLNAQVALLCSNRPQDHMRFRIDGYSKTRLRTLRLACIWRMRKTLLQARKYSKMPIISAEYCWYASPSDLERLRDFLAAESFEAKVVAYLRPIKSYTESLFQQQTKWAFGEFDPISRFREPGAHSLRSWSCALEKLAKIFGEQNLTIRPFVRSALVEGCAVRDFCQTVGITLDSRKVIRTNESLSADGVRFLYAYNRFCPPDLQPSFQGRMQLIQKFENLAGEPFRFHSDIFAPIAATIAAEEHRLWERYGIDISEDLREADDGPCVRETADLFRFGRASLDWLAESSGSSPIIACEGECAARAVATQVRSVYRRLARLTYRERFIRKLHRALPWAQNTD